MRRKVVLLCLTFLVFFSQSVFAFSFISDNSQKIIEDTWNAQTMNQLEDGVVAVPQTAIDNYLQSVLAEYPEFKQVKLNIHADNKIEADIDTAASGKIKVEGTITAFKQNKDMSSMTVHIDKKELLNRPVTSWLFSRMSIGMLMKLFGNPLSDNQYGVAVEAKDNNLIINFKPFIDKSSLKQVEIMGNSLVDAVNIDDITSAEGVLYLHTSINGGNMLINTIKNIL
ncbi:hypothetical protein [Pectinatus brassicae]|uniref:DUF2993 domain-containing protein n=1 Tax=Pectinatus brassicae TaxID=862415 RepID=A0A840UK08_9FIRM|nr:hypothetical protein [Pectinatus brassicae]MBB5335028.1 hypothetical protein [Pectinatus brassicae]